jgi:hypothetical protein
MRRTAQVTLLVLAVAGAVAGLWPFLRGGGGSHAVALGGQNALSKKFNLHLWVPEEDLTVWDPINVNVNPVPWRVYGKTRDDGVRESTFRHTAIGKSVRVEGIAWGYDVKTDLPTSRVIFEGGTVMVRGMDFNHPAIRGKSVRVIGTLRRGTMPRRGFDLQYPHYYYVDARTFNLLDRVVEPNVILTEPTD